MNGMIALAFVMALSFSASAFGAHDHKAPHGGTLIVLREEFATVELVLEPEKGKLTAYVFDGCVERAVRIKQKEIELRIILAEKKDEPLAVTLKGVANVLTGEKEGDTSQFDAVVPQLRGARRFSGVIRAITARGVEFKDVRFAFPEEHDEVHR
jgi:hypothetical protein